MTTKLSRWPDHEETGLTARQPDQPESRGYIALTLTEAVQVWYYQTLVLPSSFLAVCLVSLLIIAFVTAVPYSLKTPANHWPG